jgi:glycosyltransferase involved in cell wall biosynthesis
MHTIDPSKPCVSVVIPTYNYGHFISEAIDSALAQTYGNIEVIVVDDGSTDDTGSRLNAYGDRIRYIYQPNAGLSAARNTGIKNAKGDFIAFLDSDDAFHPQKLELQMDFFAAEPQLGLVGTEAFSELPLAWGKIPNRKLPLRIFNLSDIVTRNRFVPSSVVVRKECFDAAGLFDLTLRSVEDREMWIRIAAAQFPLGKIILPLTWYRLSPGSMSKNPERMEHFERVVLDRAFQIPELAGRQMLRRKAIGLAEVGSAWVYYAAGRPLSALRRVFRSFWWWPLPYRRRNVPTFLFRLRLSIGCFRRLFRLSSP